MEILNWVVANWELIAMAVITITNPVAQVPALIGTPAAIKKVKAVHTIYKVMTGNTLHASSIEDLTGG